MGPEGFRAYEYVDDGAFAEPWLDTRPWTSVRIWELGLQTCLGAKALHEEKKTVEGTCATRVNLWGLLLCTESETLSLPEPKLTNAREFLAQSYFDPGVTRIPLGVIQELRGKAEHWCLCNESLGPELHVIDKLLCSYRGLSQPKGDEATVKQIYFDFWDTMETIRVNMSDPRWWSTTYTTSFQNILTLQERLSFQSTRSSMMWVGSDATLHNCAAVNHTLKTFTVFRASEFIDFLSDLTGLPRGDYELIAITEYMSLICFLTAQEPVLKGRFICYVGDNQNVITWIKHKRPGNRVAKYFTRILSRMENEWGFVLAPMYISSSNNVLQDELSRLDSREAILHGEGKGFEYVDVSRVTHHYFVRRLSEFSIILPTDSDDRVRSIMQYVEKRIVRHIPPNIISRLHVTYCGLGSNHWSGITNNPRLSGLKGRVMPWPSECSALGQSPGLPTRNPGWNVFVGSIPHNAHDLAFLHEALCAVEPVLLVVDCHPSLRFNPQSFPWLTRNRRHWDWLVSAAALGEPQARDRKFHVSTNMPGACADFMSPLFIFDVTLPAVLSEYLRTTENIPHLVGDFRVSRTGNNDICQPTPLGWISLPKGVINYGTKVSTPSGSGVVIALSDNEVRVDIEAMETVVPRSKCTIVPTKYQV